MCRPGPCCTFCSCTTVIKSSSPHSHSYPTLEMLYTLNVTIPDSKMSGNRFLKFTWPGYGCMWIKKIQPKYTHILEWIIPSRSTSMGWLSHVNDSSVHKQISHFRFFGIFLFHKRLQDNFAFKLRKMGRDKSLDRKYIERAGALWIARRIHSQGDYHIVIWGRKGIPKCGVDTDFFSDTNSMRASTTEYQTIVLNPG